MKQEVDLHKAQSGKRMDMHSHDYEFYVSVQVQPLRFSSGSDYLYKKSYAQ